MAVPARDPVQHGRVRPLPGARLRERAAVARAARSSATAAGYFDLRLPLHAHAAARCAPTPTSAACPSLPFYPFWQAPRRPGGGARAGRGLLPALSAAPCRAAPRACGASAIVTAGLVFPVWLVTFLVDEGPVGLSARASAPRALARRAAALAAPGRGAAVAWAAGGRARCSSSGCGRSSSSPGGSRPSPSSPLEEARRQGLSLDDARPAACARAPGGSSGAPCCPPPSCSRARTATAVPTRRCSGTGTSRPSPRTWKAWPSGSSATSRTARSSPRAISTLPSWPVDLLPLLLSVALLVAGLALERAPARGRDLGGPLGPDLCLRGLERLQPVAAPLRLPAAAPGLRPRPLRSTALPAARTPRRRGGGRRSSGRRSPRGCRRRPTRPTRRPTRTVSLAAVREKGLDRSTLQVHASWGTYYIAQLFGDPERMVVYARRCGRTTRRGCGRWRSWRAGRGRPLLLVSSRRWERLQTPEVEAVLGRPERTWQFGELVGRRVRPRSRSPSRPRP